MFNSVAQAEQALHATDCDWLGVLGTFFLLAAKVPNLLLLHVRLLGARDGTRKVPAKVPKLCEMRTGGRAQKPENFADVL